MKSPRLPPLMSKKLIPSTAEKYLEYDKSQLAIENQIRHSRRLKLKQPESSDNISPLTVETSRLDALSPIMNDKELTPGVSSLSISKYIHNEIFGVKDNPLSNSSETANKKIENFLSVPFSLECLIWFGFAICMDAFLYLFTFLPIRVVVQWCSVLYWYSRTLLGLGVSNGTGVASSIGTQHMYDMLCIIVIIIACVVLQFFDMSYTYHFIRGQSMIKLYVLTSMLDVLERLLCSFGEDALTSMYYRTSVMDKPSAHQQYPVIYMIASMSLYTLYVVVHSCFYFIKVATLTVAFNTTDQSFISILILNNFAEMKSHVFKKFDNTQLFELTCADIAERFQTTLFLFCMIMIAFGQSPTNIPLWEVFMPYLRAGLLMNVSEIISDWIKHAFINKFNRISSKIYDNFARRLRTDLLLDSDHSEFAMNSNKAMRKIGLTHVSFPIVSYWFIIICVFYP